jgi:hypothetical protein
MAVSIAKGFNTKAVIVPEAMYGTLAESGQQALPIISETLTKNYVYMQNEVKVAGGASRLPSQLGNQTAGGTVTCEWDYDNCSELLTAAIGSLALGVFTPTEDLDDKYSIILDKELKRHQFLGGMCQEMRIRGGAGINNGKTLLETDWIFRSMTESDTAILADTLTASGKIKHSNLTFRIGNGTDALAAGDALPLVEYTFRVRNNLSVIYASGNSGSIIQPVRQSMREVTLEITLPYYSSDDETTAIKTAAAAHSLLQADFTWSDGTDTMLLQIGEMYLGDYPNQNIESHDMLPFKAMFDVVKNVNNQTYLTAVDYDFLLTLTLGT